MSPVISTDNNEFKVDFTKVNWLAVTRVLWAAVKTVKPNTPAYAEWMKKTQGVDTWTVRQKVDEAITECFFRSEAAGEEATDE